MQASELQLYFYIFRQTCTKMCLLKSCSYDCSALKNTTVQFSGEELFSAAMKHESLRR